MSTLEEVKRAAERLTPSEQFELFRWWKETEIFKKAQSEALKKEINIGMEQLDKGQYKTYDEHSLGALAKEIKIAGRKRLQQPKNTN